MYRVLFACSACHLRTRPEKRDTVGPGSFESGDAAHRTSLMRRRRSAAAARAGQESSIFKQRCLLALWAQSAAVGTCEVGYAVGCVGYSASGRGPDFSAARGVADAQVTCADYETKWAAATWYGHPHAGGEINEQGKASFWVLR